MKKKSTLIVVIVLVLLLLISILVVIKKRQVSTSPVVENSPAVELPINTIPLLERPFVTLTPDSSGHNLTLGVDGLAPEGTLEYEIIYNAIEKQEGVFGRIELAKEKQPLKKTLLLGSQSAGGKVTYHEGVTGGSLTLTLGTTRLKESFNFLHFDPLDPSITSSDVRFSATLPKTALTKNAVIVVMKSFGLPDPTSLPGSSNVIAGPYTFLTPSPVKGSVAVSLKLPAGEHVAPSVFEYSASSWTKLPTTLEGDTVSATTSTGHLFVVTAE